MGDSPLDVSKMKVNELRAELSKRGLTIAGLKPVLIKVDYPTITLSL